MQDDAKIALDTLTGSRFTVGSVCDQELNQSIEGLWRYGMQGRLRTGVLGFRLKPGLQSMTYKCCERASSRPNIARRHKQRQEDD